MKALLVILFISGCSLLIDQSEPASVQEMRKDQFSASSWRADMVGNTAQISLIINEEAVTWLCQYDDKNTARFRSCEKINESQSLFILDTFLSISFRISAPVAATSTPLDGFVNFISPVNGFTLVPSFV